MTFCVLLIRANKYWLSADGGLWAGCCLWFRESSAEGPKGVLLLSIRRLPMRRNLSPWPQLTPPDILINTEYLSYTVLLCLTHGHAHTRTHTPHLTLISNKKSKHTRTQSQPHTHSLSLTNLVKERHINSVAQECVSPLPLTQTHIHAHTHSQKMTQACWNDRGLQQTMDIGFVFFLWWNFQEQYVSRCPLRCIPKKPHRWLQPAFTQTLIVRMTDSRDRVETRNHAQVWLTSYQPLFSRATNCHAAPSSNHSKGFHVI